MAADDDLPPWFAILRTDMASMEERLRADMVRNVSRDLYDSEQRNHQEQHRLLQERIKEESTARVSGEEKLAEQIEATKQAQIATELARKQGVRRLWYALGIGLPAAAALVGIIEALTHH